jgi:acyl-CoA dehydrogenase
MTPTLARPNFTEEHAMFRESARRFYAGEVAVHRERWRQQGMVDREIFLKAGEMGYLCMWADERHGGAGVDDLRYEQILIEEQARVCETGFFGSLHSRIVAPYFRALATPEQLDRFMPKFVTGEHILAIAMTEPGTGSDLMGMKTQAVDRGDYWELSGQKTYISNGILSDVVVVAARTETGRKNSIGLFVVERGMPGFERGKRLKKMGLDSQDTAELFFEGVKVPKNNVLGDPGRGMSYLMAGLAEERLIGALQAHALAESAFTLTRSYVQERKAFGQRIADFQNTRFRIATLRARLDALQVYLDRLVDCANAGQLSGDIAAGAKLLATELLSDMVDEGVQLHGGAGFMEEYPICQLYRDARIFRILAGTSEVMKEIIARSALDV